MLKAIDMCEASVMTIQVPPDLKHRIAMAAEAQGVSVNQFAICLFTKEIENLEAGRMISAYWKDYPEKEILSGFDEVMAKVTDRPVPDWDKMSADPEC